LCATKEHGSEPGGWGAVSNPWNGHGKWLWAHFLVYQWRQGLDTECADVPLRNYPLTHLTLCISHEATSVDLTRPRLWILRARSGLKHLRWRLESWDVLRPRLKPWEPEVCNLITGCAVLLEECTVNCALLVSTEWYMCLSVAKSFMWRNLMWKMLCSSSGLVIHPEGPLNPDKDPLSISEMFRPFQTLLFKIRYVVWSYSLII